jgi:hypothetical protein
MALPSHVALYHKTVHDSIDGGRLFLETAVPTRPISHGLWHRRTLRSPPRQRPPDLYRHNVDQTSRRHRTTVPGWTISRASRQCGHHHDSKIQNSRSQTRKQGRRVPLRFNTAIWWRSAIASNSSAVRLPGSPRVTATASSLGILMRAAYRQTFEITIESCGLSFEEGQQDRTTSRILVRSANIAPPTSTAIALRHLGRGFR